MPLSKNSKRVLAILSVIEGAAMVAEREFAALERNRTRMRHCEAIRTACENAARAWKDIREVSRQDVSDIGEELLRFDRQNADLIARHGPRTVLNFSLALATDLEEVVKDAKKKASLADLRVKIQRFVVYLDRRLAHPSIDDAIELAKRWPFPVNEDVA